MKYKIDKRFTCITPRSPRILECAEVFGLGLEEKEFVIYDEEEFEVEQGDIVFITGQSGSGKSLLLRELAQQMELKGMTVGNIDQVLVEDKPLIEQIGKDMNEAIQILSLAGLNDAYLFIRTPQELSDGQLYRFRIARLMEQKTQVWVADEFGAILDRTTAKVVAMNLQKFARQCGATVIVATTHRDLEAELAPNLHIEKRFREHIEVKVNRD